MAIRDIERFRSVVLQGPDVFTDALLAAEGIAPDVDKQRRRDLATFIAARFAQWEAESGVEPGCSSERADLRFGSIPGTPDGASLSSDDIPHYG